jgi:hypothetical protein
MASTYMIKNVFRATWGVWAAALPGLDDAIYLHHQHGQLQLYPTAFNCLYIAHPGQGNLCV